MKANRNRLGRSMLASAVSITLFSCTTVKQYQKMHLNDAEMKLSAKKIQKVEQNFQIYREGASGANGGKSGGGCGCN